MNDTRLSVSVVVATLGRPELGACLESLVVQSHTPDEIIVVDNSGSSAAAQPMMEGVRCIPCTKRGIAAARNAGVRIATGDVIAFIDDDARAHREWLAQVVAALERAPIAGLAGAVVESAEEESARPATVVERSSPDWFWKTNFGGVGNGANLAFRREHFLAVGGFDEKLGLGTDIPTSEEHNLFFRLVAAGESVAYVPEAVVYHPRADARAQRRRHLQTQRAAAAYVCYLWEHFPESRVELKKLLRRGRTPLASRRRESVSPQWARWLYRGLGLADYLKARV